MNEQVEKRVQELLTVQGTLEWDVFEAESMQLIEKIFTSEQQLAPQLVLRDVWLIVSALQLANVHPALSDELRTYHEELGRRLQSMITELYPAAAVLSELGWNRNFDFVPSVEFADEDDWDDDDWQ